MKVNLYVKELESRIKGAKDRFELLRLREDISRFMESPQFKQLPGSDKDYVIDLLAEVYAKEEQYKGCDPWKSILGCY